MFPPASTVCIEPQATLTTLEMDFCQRLRDVTADYPELGLVTNDLLRKIERCDSQSLPDLQNLLTAWEQALVRLKHLLNPTGLPLTLSEDGRILTQTFRRVTSFVTDIRGFTELTQNVSRLFGVSVFEVLSYCYFPHVTAVLDRYQCHYLNYTGDGLLVLSLDRTDTTGQVCLPSLDNAVLCAMDLTTVTNSIASTWGQLGLTQANGALHETGLGLHSGDVEVGDPFVPDKAYTGICAQFDTLFRQVITQHAPHFQPLPQYNGDIRSIHALSPAINRSSRLQDTDKLAPAHTCMMSEADVQSLCPPLSERFERVSTMYLKGIGDVEVFGIQRYMPADIPSLITACKQYYQEQSLPTLPA